MSYTTVKILETNTSKQSGYTLSKNLKVGDSILVSIYNSDSDDGEYSDYKVITKINKGEHYSNFELAGVYSEDNPCLNHTRTGKYIKRIKGV